MVKAIVVAVLVGVVILTECVFAYLLIPSRTDLEAWATEKAAKEHPTKEEAHDAHGGKGER